MRSTRTGPNKMFSKKLPRCHSVAKEIVQTLSKFREIMDVCVACSSIMDVS